MKINLTDKYKTKSGYHVTVYAVDLNDWQYTVLAVVHYNNRDTVRVYKENGQYCHLPSDNDLIKVTPYDHIKIDDKVWVWNGDGTLKYKRHFAGINDDGRPMTFNDGTTSWTYYEKPSWDHCEKVDD